MIPYPRPGGVSVEPGRLRRGRRVAGMTVPGLLLASCCGRPRLRRAGGAGGDGYTTERRLQRRPARRRRAVRPGLRARQGPARRLVGAVPFRSGSTPLSMRRPQPSRHPGRPVRAAAARENALSQAGALFPQSALTGSAEREQATTAQPGHGRDKPRSITLYNTSVSVSYALDLWGGTRRQVEALQAQADYQAFTLEATYLALTANVVTAAITDASLRDQSPRPKRSSRPRRTSSTGSSTSSTSVP